VVSVAAAAVVAEDDEDHFSLVALVAWAALALSRCDSHT
jgi:hypothetical protein